MQIQLPVFAALFSSLQNCTNIRFCEQNMPKKTTRYELTYSCAKVLLKFTLNKEDIKKTMCNNYNVNRVIFKNVWAIWHILLSDTCVNCWMRDDLPTPDSPTSTTYATERYIKSPEWEKDEPGCLEMLVRSVTWLFINSRKLVLDQYWRMVMQRAPDRTNKGTAWLNKKMNIRRTWVWMTDKLCVSMIFRF